MRKEEALWKEEKEKRERRERERKERLERERLLNRRPYYLQNSDQFKLQLSKAGTYYQDEKEFELTLKRNPLVNRLNHLDWFECENIRIRDQETGEFKHCYNYQSPRQMQLLLPDSHE